MQPLKGITVVTLEHAIAAPFATRQLADMGARVIKVERPGVGDFARGYDERVHGLASHFVWTNRSKESLTLDVKHDEAQKILMRLILEEADIVVQNLAPGAASRLGLSYETLSKLKPGIIVCDISGYGSDGPYRDKKAYDLLIQSEAGFVSVTGTPDTPSKAGPSIADIAAGMYAYTNILAALMHRQQTGQGQRIDISMLESLAESVAADVRARRAIEADRAKPRTTARWVTIITISVLGFLTLTGDYISPYGSPLGQLLLILLLSAYVGLLIWMRNMAKGEAMPRFLGVAAREGAHP